MSKKVVSLCHEKSPPKYPDGKLQNVRPPVKKKKKKKSKVITNKKSQEKSCARIFLNPASIMTYAIIRDADEFTY